MVVILDALAPWWPDVHPAPNAETVINIGPDPLFSRFPVRNFRSDIALRGESADTIPALVAEMQDMPRGTAVAARRQRLAETTAAARERLQQTAVAETERGITKAYVSACLGAALEGRTSSVFSELGTKLGVLERREPCSWFQEPHSGGLGWSFPAALGAKLAEPERTCVATMGDGSYMFANPTACHQVAEALGLGVVVIILNNEEWGAVRASVAGLYPAGVAASANQMPLTALKPTPEFTKTAEASRAFARRITDPAELPAALEEALGVADTGRQALLDVAVLPD